MRVRIHFILAAALLVISLSFTAMGQSKARGLAERLPPEPIYPVVTINAIEISDGTIGFAQNKEETIFGYSFLGRTTGSLPGSFTLSMNCTPTTTAGGETTVMTGGAWTLPVYDTALKGSSSYAGSMYGTIANGKMAWDKTGRSAEVYFMLNVDGGTQTYQGTKGYASFSGNLFYDEKVEEMVLKGTLVFNTLSSAN